MADLIVDSHLIASYRNRVNAVDAISELIDNSLAAKATVFELMFFKDKVVVLDNGGGLKNLNLLTKLGASSQTGNNVYGVGFKDAVMHFGSFVRIDSICNGQYRHHQIDWDDIELNGTPKPHNPKTILPLAKAPGYRTMAESGTAIMISRLSSGRSRIYPDAIVKRLSHRYRPALRLGKTITISFSDERACKLSADAEFLGLWKNEREIMGMAAERIFSLRYTDLKEYDRNLTGIHVAYGDRFIEHITSLGGKTLPNLLYAEVTLGNRWRDCLSPNKTALRRFKDELETAIYELMKEWIKELEAFADEARIEKLNVILQKHTAEILIFKPGDGNNRKSKKAVVTDRPDGPGPAPEPNPHDKQNEAKPDDKSAGDGEKRKRRPGGLLFKRDDTLGKLPFLITPNLETQQITVKLNGSIPAINTAYEVPYKIPALWPLISAAFANWIRDNISNVDVWLPDFFNIMRSEGYEIDPEYPSDAELYVLAWMMHQHPPSIKELEARGVA